MSIIEKIIEFVGDAQTSSASYTPTTAYTGGLPNVIVRSGSKGTDVKHLQNFLNWCIQAKLKVDGICGKNTVSAIKCFQKKYELKADGIFGEKSKAKAKTIIAKYAPKPISKPKDSTSGENIVAKAKEYAWAYGTSKKNYAYKTGCARTTYRNALKEYMGKSARVSQTDCGYFVSTCVMGSGLAKPKSFSCNEFKKPPETMKIVLKGEKKKIPEGFLKAGDCIRYHKTNGNNHAMVYIGNGQIAEAQRYSGTVGTTFPHITKDMKKYNKSNVTYIEVLRAK